MRRESAVEGGDALMRLTAEQKEVIAILVAAADGETTEEQRARVEQLVKESEEMQSFVLRLLNQEAWLSLHSLHESTRPVRAELATKIRELLTAAEACTVSQAVADQYASDKSIKRKALADAGRARAQPVLRRWAGYVDSQSARHWAGPIAYAALLLGIGVAIGAWIKFPSQFRETPALVVGSTPNSGDGARREGMVAANYEARLVQFTSCVWGEEMRPRTSDSLRGGDPLNLIYGLAELELGWSTQGKVRVRLEGPAGMVLMTHGGVNLNHGKLTANVALEHDRFAVETPLGRVEVAEDASIGVAVSPNSVEFHVFSGEAKVVTSWTADSLASDTLVVDEGQSIQLVASADGAVAIGRDIAAPSIFVSQIPMSDDLLDISDSYVTAIKEAAPVCYWRFNRPVDGLIRNEMADRYHGQILGDIEWAQEHDNWTIQCGRWLATDMPPTHVIADRPLESVGIQSYSLEAWVKPSHAHLATIASLLSPGSKEPVFHGMLLELGGPSTIFTGREHPGRVRYLHRNPPEVWGGNSCFSNRPYGLRKWQHIAAVKDRSEMRLYIDGKQLAQCKDTTPLPDGLLLLVGQLGQIAHERVFVGQLDELAYYERALSQKEIEKHYRLVRPKAMPTGI
jgi:hypothetical protein